MLRARSWIAAGVVIALVAGCASPRTKAEHRAALDACLASPNPAVSVECERADILRDQLDYERSENTALAVGALAVGVLTLGFVDVLDDDRYHYRGHRFHGRHGFRGHRRFRGHRGYRFR